MRNWIYSCKKRRLDEKYCKNRRIVFIVVFSGDDITNKGKRYETNTHVDKGSGNKEIIKVKYNHDDPSENVSGFGESFSFVLIGFLLGASMLALCIWSMKFAKSIIKLNFQPEEGSMSP